MNATSYNLTSLEREKWDATQSAYFAVRDAITAVNVALRDGAVYRSLFWDDENAYIDRDQAPTREHMARVEKLCLMLEDLHHHDASNFFSVTDAVISDKMGQVPHFALVGVSSHVIDLIERLNNAKAHFKSVVPKDDVRREGGERLHRLILNDIEKRLSVLSIARQTPIIMCKDQGTNNRPGTNGPLSALSLGEHTNYKANTVSLKKSYELATIWARKNNIDPIDACRSLPSGDDDDEIVLWDKRAHRQGVVQSMYLDPATQRSVQRLKKTSMPVFYDAQVCGEVTLRLTKPQSKKKKHQRAFLEQRLLLDMGQTALCAPNATGTPF